MCLLKLRGKFSLMFAFEVFLMFEFILVLGYCPSWFLTLSDGFWSTCLLGDLSLSPWSLPCLGYRDPYKPLEYLAASLLIIFFYLLSWFVLILMLVVFPCILCGVFNIEKGTFYILLNSFRCYRTEMF